ncbi:MAG: winged helix-turn-helix domain-containing protein, partial [Solirubrobacterales bacterium]|nr:winged helix-turn-helix domain-containing protein [Solirubrobacterales bacterium]
MGVGPRLELGMLGPFEVRIDPGSAVALGGLRQRALLAVLALRANEVVSTDRLIDELWSENPPATAVHSVQVCVSRLRGILGPAGRRLVTRPPGYVLELGVDELDSERCQRLYEAARSALAVGNAVGAASLLGEALALWRGPPLSDFTYEPFAQAAIARLEELRISCREELIDAELALGRHAEVVSTLEALVREHPFRERPRGQLMLALYRCGRQADALEEFQRTRAMLVEQLAVEPGAELRELEQAILSQDECLQPPVTDRVPAADSTRAADVVPEYERRRTAPDDHGVSAEVSHAAMVRKTATVLVSRLSPSGQVDPETARRAMTSARERAEEIVTKHGGAFVGALGGDLVWVFGVPLVKEDDALRALRAADELRRQLSAWTDAEPCRLTARLGVATGEVVAEAPSDVFGDPLTRAITLTQAAEVGEVLLGEMTRRLALSAIQAEPAADPAAWRLVGLVAESALTLGLQTPMVGRDD